MPAPDPLQPTEADRASATKYAAELTESLNRLRQSGSSYKISNFFESAILNSILKERERAARVAELVVPFDPGDDVSPMNGVETWMVRRMRECTAAAIRRGG